MARLRLHNELIDILGNTNVYFQPPSNIKLRYPCVVYSLSRIELTHANNDNYKMDNKYTVTLIQADPDDKAFVRMLRLPRVSFDTTYVADSLNHYVYTTYYN